MKVLFISPTAGNAGIDQTASSLCIGLSKMGWDVTMVAPMRPSSFTLLTTHGVDILVCETLNWWFTLDFEDSNFFNSFTNQGPVIRALSEIIRDADPDVVIGNTTVTLAPGLAAILNGKPFITHLHAQFEPEIFSGMSREFEASLFEIFSGLGEIVCPSSQVLLEVAGKLKDQRSGLVRIPNGVDITKFHSAPDLHPPQDFRYVSLGHLNDNKNQKFLVQVAIDLLRAGTSKFVFQIIGTPENQYLEELEALINTHELQKHFDIIGNQTDVRPFLHGARAFISTSKTETFPIAMLEAMACGVPVVSSPTSGAREILPEGSSSLCTTSEEFANALIGLSDANLWQQNSHAVSERVQSNFTETKYVESFSRLIVDVVERAGQPGADQSEKVVWTNFTKLLLASQLTQTQPGSALNIAVILADPEQTSSKLLFEKPFKHFARSFGLKYEVITSTPSPQAIKQFHGLYVLRAFGPSVLAIVKSFKAQGLPVIFETDDNHFEITSAGSGVEHKSLANPDLEAIVETSSQVLVYSRELLESFKEINASTVLMPTYQLVEKNNEPRVNRFPRTKVGFMGSLNKDLDFEFLQGFFEKILMRYPSLEIEFLGFKPKYLESNPRVSAIPFDKDYDRFVASLKQREWAVGLAPLSDTKFNRSKTNNKYREYAAAGIPGIFSNIEPYSTSVDDGVTGILADNNENAWLRAFQSLYADATKQAELVREAFKDVSLNYSFEAYLDKKWGILEKLVASSSEKHASGEYLGGIGESILAQGQGYLETGLKIHKRDKILAVRARPSTGDAQLGLELVSKGEIIFNSVSSASLISNSGEGLYFFSIEEIEKPSSLPKMQARLYSAKGSLAIETKPTLSIRKRPSLPFLKLN